MLGGMQRGLGRVADQQSGKNQILAAAVLVEARFEPGVVR